MTIFPFIFDSHCPWQTAEGSLLLVPHGIHTLLEEICDHLAGRIQESTTILTAFAPDDVYHDAVRRTGANAETVAPAENFATLLSSYEPSDWILFIDPRHYPVDGLDLHRFLSGKRDTRSARHLVALDLSEQGTKEYVQFDAAGQVRRIQRYYEGVTWLHASSVFCSMVSVACLRLLEQPALGSLLEVRGSVAACGVPSRDVLLAGGTMDLHDPRNLLKLTEQTIVRLQRGAAPATYQALGKNIWIARTSRVDPAACIHGPVILQDDVTVQAGAVIIGPTLLGAGSTVCQGATVAQCLLVQHSEVPADGTVCHKVLAPPPPGETIYSQTPALAETIPTSQPGPISPIGRLQYEHPRHGYPTIKQVIDQVFATLGLILLSPLLLLTTVLVKLGSRGPVLFGHEREGKDGRLFRCWKFRTMVQGAHAKQRALYTRSGVDGPQFKIDNDPRIARIGSILRKTNIDELPQLVNVWLGQMSLIGPRPSPFRENQICIPWRQARLSVRPGITGLWQICRSNRSSGDFHQWIYYDMLYVRHMSLWLDLKILLGTLITFGGHWGLPVTWMIPPKRLYNETRPWIIPMLDPIAGDDDALTAGAVEARHPDREPLTAARGGRLPASAGAEESP